MVFSPLVPSILKSINPLYGMEKPRTSFNTRPSVPPSVRFFFSSFFPCLQKQPGNKQAGRPTPGSLDRTKKKRAGHSCRDIVPSHQSVIRQKRRKKSDQVLRFIVQCATLRWSKSKIKCNHTLPDPSPHLLLFRRDGLLSTGFPSLKSFCGWTRYFYVVQS